MNPFRIIATLVLCLASLAPGAVPVKTYTFVYITTGPATDIEQSEQQTAFAGHFSNMKRMAEEGDLLIAGPFGKSESFDDLRGLWVFNTDSTAKALELAATDPPGKLGIFVFEAVQLITDDALLELPRLEREDEARRLADPDVLDAWSGRGYFIATAPVSKTDEPTRTSSVFMLATLTADPDTRVTNDQRMLILDATTEDEAHHALKDSGCNPDDWKLDVWYASSMIAKLPSLRE
tara:strand:+ start:5247 stop:5951 length:705 start_codon:yes stop_codon:yes gene_type:complete